MDSHFMPDARLAELMAAYAVPAIQAESGLQTRRRVANFLLSNTTREWSVDLLDAHRARVGEGSHVDGHWKNVTHRKRKRD